MIPGTRVAWIVTDARKSPQAVEPWIEGRPFPKDKEPDFAYYAERVAQTLARVTEVFGLGRRSAPRRGASAQADRIRDDGPTTDGNAPCSSGAATLDTPVASVSPAQWRSTQKQL